MSGRTHRWKLKKYARKSADPTDSSVKFERGKEEICSAMPPPSVAKKKTNWQLTEAVDQDLDIVLTHNHHLLVSNGATILENISLTACSKTVQGFYQGDALLIIQNVGTPPVERRFRVAFSDGLSKTGKESCAESINLLKQYITIVAKQKSNDNSQAESDKSAADALDGVVPLPKIAEMLTSKRVSDTLPLAYQQSKIPVQELDTLIRLCLTDTNFPQFVKDVEENLKKIVDCI